MTDAPWEERECQELHGIPLVRGHVTADERSGRGAVFVITDGKLHYIHRADSRFAPSQWETALLCNDISHWLSASLALALYISSTRMVTILQEVAQHN